MLDADVDTLLHVAVAHDFVDDNTDGGFCDVVDDASSTMGSCQKMSRQLLCG
jgi:hypothetical protein